MLIFVTYALSFSPYVHIHSILAFFILLERKLLMISSMSLTSEFFNVYFLNERGCSSSVYRQISSVVPLMSYWFWPRITYWMNLSFFFSLFSSEEFFTLSLSFMALTCLIVWKFAYLLALTFLKSINRSIILHLSSVSS